jgi:hypothetical protein
MYRDAKKRQVKIPISNAFSLRKLCASASLREKIHSKSKPAINTKYKTHHCQELQKRRFSKCQDPKRKKDNYTK